MVSAVGQSYAASDIGMNTEGPVKSAAEAIVPAMFMSLGFGGAIHGYSRLQADALLKDLNAEDLETRGKAAKTVANGIYGNTRDEEIAQSWLSQAGRSIELGEKIDINLPMADFGVQKVAEDKAGPLTPEGVDALVTGDHTVDDVLAEMKANPPVNPDPDTVDGVIAQQQAVQVGREPVDYGHYSGNPIYSGMLDELNQEPGHDGRIINPDWVKLKTLKAYAEETGDKVYQYVSSTSARKTLQALLAGQPLNDIQRDILDYIDTVAGVNNAVFPGVKNIALQDGKTVAGAGDNAVLTGVNNVVFPGVNNTVDDVISGDNATVQNPTVNEGANEVVTAPSIDPPVILEQQASQPQDIPETTDLPTTPTTDRTTDPAGELITPGAEATVADVEQYATTTPGSKILKHFTTEDRAKSIEESGVFNFDNDPIHGTGGFADGPKNGRFAGKRVYLSLDDNSWGTSHSFTPTGDARPVTLKDKTGDGETFYDYDKQQWMIRPSKVEKNKLRPVDVGVSPDAKTLTIDSEESYAKAVKEYGYLLDNEPVWDRIAKDFDVVEIKNTKSLSDGNKFFRAALHDQAIVLNNSVISVARKSSTVSDQLKTNSDPNTLEQDTIVSPDSNQVNVESINTPGESANEIKIVEHTVKKNGNVLRGTVVMGMTKKEAAKIDPYTMAKDGGFFIREKHFDKLPQAVKEDSPTLNDADKASTVENSPNTSEAPNVAAPNVSDPIAKLHSTIDQTYQAQADRLKQTGRPVPRKADLHAYADKEHSEGGQGGTVMDMINDLSDEMGKDNAVVSTAVKKVFKKTSKSVRDNTQSPVIESIAEAEEIPDVSRVSDHVGKKHDVTPEKLKEQKQWLLDNIDKALSDIKTGENTSEAVQKDGAITMNVTVDKAMVGREYKGKIYTFDVPGDGQFDVQGTEKALALFRKGISSLKTDMKKEPLPYPKSPAKTSNVRPLMGQDGNSEGDYTPRASGNLSLTKNDIHYQSQGGDFSGNGAFMVKSSVFNIRSKDKPQTSRFGKDRMDELAERSISAKATKIIENYDRFGAYQVVRVEGKGIHSFIDVKILDPILNNRPKASIRIDPLQGMVSVYENGEMIAVIGAVVDSREKGTRPPYKADLPSVETVTPSSETAGEDSSENVKKSPEKDTAKTRFDVELLDAQTFTETQLAGLEIKIDVDYNGEILSSSESAHEELSRIDKEITDLEKLKDCMKKGR
ncbi:MAG: hypothetical protein JZU65_16105 [Chlorobium sp.]|nr:hypothetical protein [Chlorobium sp.]